MSPSGAAERVLHALLRQRRLAVAVLPGLIFERARQQGVQRVERREVFFRATAAVITASMRWLRGM